MACSIEQIERDGISKIKGMIKGKAKNIVFNGNIATFLTKGKKIRTKDQALVVAQKKQQAIEEWSNNTFKDKRYGGWTTLSDVNGTIQLEVKFPPLLLRAYETKINNEKSIAEMYAARVFSNEYVYQGEVYSSIEDMEAAMERDSDFLPNTNVVDPTNFNHYINSKKALLEKVNTRLETLQARRKYESDQDLKSEISKIKQISERLTTEIFDLTNSPNIFDKTMNVFKNDLALITTLISGDRPAIEDLHTAEYMISYFDLITDYSSDNTDNKFVNVSDPSKIEPEIKAVLDEYRGKITDFKSKIHDAKKRYLLELIENSPNVKSIFPGQEAEQIRESILKDQDDIGVVSQFFGTVDKQFTKQDSLLGQLIKEELEHSRSVNKGFSAIQIAKINALVPKVKKKLIAMGHGISWKPTNSLFSEVSYDLFYQTTERNNRTGKLVGPFSDNWYKAQASFFKNYNEVYNSTILNRDWVEMNKALVSKYDWLNENVEFLDITKLPEIINNPIFARFNNYFKPADAAYRQKLIDKIGEPTYNKLIAEQTEKLEDFIHLAQDTVQLALDSNEVTETKNLPEATLHSLNITLLRNNPFTFLQSHQSGQEGRVDYTIGTAGNQYQSHLKYNTYLPKIDVKKHNFQTGQTVDANYYDANFDTIRQDKDLLDFWEVLNDSAEFMNSTLSDASKKLTHNSLPHMEKFAVDILLDKEMSIATKISTLFSSTRESLGNMFSIKDKKLRANDVEQINKSSIVHIQDRIGIRYKTEMLKLKNSGVKLTPQVLAELKEEITHSVAMEQTFNLPVIMKAYLDMVAEYKSQKDSLPKISIFKSLYENIKLEKSNSFDPITDVADAIKTRARKNGIQDKRYRANTRMNHWYNKNVMNLEDKEYWVNFGKLLGEKGKFYNNEEKALLEELKKEKTRLENKILKDNEASNLDPSLLTEEFVNAQIKDEENLERTINDIKDLGKDIALASIYNVIFNKFKIFTGLAYNLPSNISNRFQGWYSGAINDTGKYWTAGNFTIANGFISKKGLRYIPGNNKYKNEIKKTRLFIDKLNIIQDATNEIDKAKNESGFTGIIKKLNPFYITEYTEWHNQTPQILSMLMDEKIKDVNGKEVSIFDGTSFPAHMINVEGELVLKPEFNTEDNINTWQSFSNSTSASIKSGIGNKISILNGDYSKTGSTYIKSSNFGKTVMTFKTWLPNQIWQRFAYNQKSLSMGMERFDGTYAGAYTSSKTSTAATALFTTGLLTAGVMGLPLVLGGAIAAGAITGNIYMNRSRKNIAGAEELMIASQLAEAGIAVVKKMIGLPINTLFSKDIIKAHQFNKLNVSEAEKQNLNSIVSEISILLGMALAKVIIKAMFAPNDDDEPENFDKDGKSKNPYAGTNARTEAEKQIYNLLENQITKNISEISLYMNPDAMYTSMSNNSVLSWFTRIKALSGAANKAMQGLDQLSTGPNAGESRLLNEMQKTFLPSVAQGNLGFERMMKQEFNPNENMDSWFFSDYKKDRKSARSDRSVERQKLLDYWKEEFDYEGQDMSTKDELDKVINKLINEEIEALNPYPERFLYDDEQQRIR